MKHLQEKQVVTCFLRNRGEVLLLRRSRKVGSYRGRWGAVSGHMNGSPVQTALQEIAEETCLEHDVELARAGDPFTVEDPDLETRWIIHPFLFDCASRDPQLDWESTEAEWVPPTEILRRDTVPQLWTSYSRVAPSAETIRADRVHGSAYLSYEALQVLRDEAASVLHRNSGGDADWSQLKRLAKTLVEARPAMAVIANRVNRAMHRCREAQSAAVVEKAAAAVLVSALEADDLAAKHAASYAADRRLITVSRSGTTLEGLLIARPQPKKIIVAESRPGGEGVSVAESLSRAGKNVLLVPDSAIPHVIQQHSVDLVLIGADAVLPSGAFVNKIGTLAAALAAKHYETPCYVVSALDKLKTKECADTETAATAATYAGAEAIEAVCPVFETISSEFVTAYVTEKGEIAPGSMASRALEYERLSSW